LDPVSSDDVTLVLDEQDVPNDIKEILTVDMLLVTIDYELAKNFFECEEVSTGQEYLERCLTVIQNSYSSSPIYTCLHISVNNQLSLIWSNRGEFEKAHDYLKIAEDIYKLAKSNGLDSPLNYNEIWQEGDKCNDNRDRHLFFERIHTLTLYYLAQVSMKLGNNGTSAKYCHITLVRQMDMDQYDPLEWSINCATLSQYYITQNQFNLSRYCLSCSEVVNKEAFVEFETKEFSEANEKDRAQEKLHKSRADIYMCWAKYGLNLLEVSHTENAGDESGRQEVLNKDSVDNDDKTYRELRFPNLEVTMHEEQVTDNVVKDYASAKLLFNFGTSYLQKSKEFYKLDGYVSNFVEITQDTSQLYKYLAFFDDDFENRTKMHKRRINMLNEILVELNPKHFLQICRQLTFEIAEVYAEMVSLKKAIIEEDSSRFSVHSVKKINYLILQGIKYYTAFIDSYKKDGVLPEKYEDDDVRGVLLCYFCIARLNSKYCTVDKETKKLYLLKEKECYEYIVKYCNENTDMPKVFQEEEKITREMLALFSGKMNNILNAMP